MSVNVLPATSPTSATVSVTVPFVDPASLPMPHVAHPDPEPRADVAVAVATVPSADVSVIVSPVPSSAARADVPLPWSLS